MFDIFFLIFIQILFDHTSLNNTNENYKNFKIQFNPILLCNFIFLLSLSHTHTHKHKYTHTHTHKQTNLKTQRHIYRDIEKYTHS